MTGGVPIDVAALIWEKCCRGWGEGVQDVVGSYVRDSESMGVLVGVFGPRLVLALDVMSTLRRTSEPQESQTYFGGWGVALNFIPYEHAIPCQLVPIPCKIL